MDILIPSTHSPANSVLVDFFSTQTVSPLLFMEHNNVTFFKARFLKLYDSEPLKMNPWLQDNTEVSFTLFSCVCTIPLSTLSDGQSFKTHVCLFIPSTLHSVPY